MRPPKEQVIWGVLGAAAAAWFAIWMLFFPQLVAGHFAWDVHPRYAMAFIGAGYIFRTAFFLNVALEGNWLRLRWIVWGNLVVHGDPPRRHVLAPRRVPLEPAPDAARPHLDRPLHLRARRHDLPDPAGRSCGRSHRRPAARSTDWLKAFLVFVTGILLMNGLLIVANPDFAAHRWAWELNPLDARIVGAWFLGWAVWSGTMAFALDWDEIRRAAQLFILNGVALLATAIVFRDEFLPGRGTVQGYAGGLLILTAVMIGFYLLQERRRPTPYA